MKLSASRPQISPASTKIGPFTPSDATCSDSAKRFRPRHLLHDRSSFPTCRALKTTLDDTLIRVEDVRPYGQSSDGGRGRVLVAAVAMLWGSLTFRYAEPMQNDSAKPLADMFTRERVVGSRAQRLRRSIYHQATNPSYPMLFMIVY